MKKLIFILLLFPALSFAEYYKVQMYNGDIYWGKLIMPVTKDSLTMLHDNHVIKIPRKQILEIQFPNGTRVKYGFFGKVEIIKPEIKNSNNPIYIENKQLRVGYAIIPGYCWYGVNFGFTIDKIGFIVNMCMNSNLSGADNYYENVSVALAEKTFEDGLVEQRKEYFAGCGILVFSLGRNVFIGGGLGTVNITQFNEYQDPYHILGNNGRYLVKANAENNIIFLPYLSLQVSPAVHMDFSYNSYFQAPYFSLGFIIQ